MRCALFAVGFCFVTVVASSQGAIPGPITPVFATPDIPACRQAAEACTTDSQCCAGLVCGPGSVCQAGCHIANGFYPPGSVNGRNSCLSCDPLVSKTSWSAVADGSSCNDQLDCTGMDSCTSGVCSGTPVVCVPDQCQSGGACDEQLGGCIFTDLPDGTDCDDGDECTTDDQCSAGMCTAGPMLVCSNLGDPILGDPCDDCNLNGMADACDVSMSASIDMDGDGLPDECLEFEQGCPGNEWSCVANWTLGNAYPNNTPVRSFSVTLFDPTDVVFLDTDVTIDTLRILDGAELYVAQLDPAGNLTLEMPGGLLIQDVTGLNRSGLFVAHSRAVDVMGDVVIGEGGVYGKMPSAVAVTASMIADNVTVKGGGCACPATEGGDLALSDEMTLQVSGDLVLEGGTESFCASPCSFLRGGVAPPPKIRSGSTSNTTVGGSVTLTGTASVDYSTSGARAAGGVVGPTLTVGGDFNNYAVDPSIYFWSPEALLILNGTAPQKFETAGNDDGPYPEGFVMNFSHGVVEVAAGAVVSFVDQFNNIGGSTDDEALYAYTLILRAGAHVTIDGAKVYYYTLIDEGATITLVNGGALSGIMAPISSPRSPGMRK